MKNGRCDKIVNCSNTASRTTIHLHWFMVIENNYQQKGRAGRLPLDRCTGTPQGHWSRGVRTATLQAAVEVAAGCSCQPTCFPIVPPAGFGGRLGMWLTAGTQPSAVRPGRNLPKLRAVGVAETGLSSMVLLEAVGAPRNRPSPFP